MPRSRKTPQTSVLSYVVSLMNTHGAVVTLTGTVKARSIAVGLYLAAREARSKAKQWKWVSVNATVEKL